MIIRDAVQGQIFFDYFSIMATRSDLAGPAGYCQGSSNESVYATDNARLERLDGKESGCVSGKQRM